jgi:anaerobic selenocysteine-containing dehydrogenase
MNIDKLKRRDFLKIMGWSGVGTTLAGCDLPTTVTLEEGKETVTSYLAPEEFVIPGVGVYYATTCQECSAGCGVHGRVREGRVLKLEGNPDSPINRSKLCQMGQSGVQTHYNPDRIEKPMIRKGDALTEATWDEALDLLNTRTGSASGLKGNRFAWLTQSVSGHQAVLLNAHLESLGSQNHYVHEVIHNAVWQQVSHDMLGDANPRLRFDKAKLILSFGTDFLGTWVSPVHFATEYGHFRTSPRGVLIQIEPKMTLTGANADLWLANRPGTEGVVALGIANVLVTKYHRDISGLPGEIQQLIKSYDLKRVEDISGLSGEHIMRVVDMLNKHSPSLVMAGASAEGVEHGYESVAAVMLLNIILGNVGNTIESSGAFPFPQLVAKTGNSSDLLAFARSIDEEGLDVVFIHGANPVYTAPAALGIKEKLKNVPFKVSFTPFMDETAAQADLVLPMASYLEDWGTHVVAYQAGAGIIGIQQPLMEKIYPETRGFGDVMITLLKMRNDSAYGQYDDYYAYLRDAFAALPSSLKMQAGSEKEFWNQTLQQGFLDVDRKKTTLTTRTVSITLPEYAENSNYPYHLVPSARLGLWDGRHANIPWLQEAPDQISKVVWDAWAELHPRTASKLGVKQGDLIEIASAQGSIEAKVYIYKGIHPDAVGVPLGQGHDEYGRYAKGRGVNPLKILDPLTDKKTGELASHATRVKLAKIDKPHDSLVRFGGSETQVGRKIVATITADQYERVEGGSDHVA